VGQFNRLTKACVVFLLWRAAAVALPAQTAPATSTAPVFTSLHSFENTDGANPYAGLVQGADGNFYGTTSEGGDLDCAVYFGCGTIFKITPSGKLTTLYSVCSQSGCPDGTDPRAGLAQDVDGNFYGTADEGGDDNCIPGFGACGTVFKITLTGTLTTLHSFEGTDGAIPGAGLVQGPDGNFHGTADEGGANTNKECARSLLKKPLLASFREKRGIDCSQKANKYDVFSERHYPIGRPEGLNQQAPSVPSRKYVHIVAGFWRRWSRPWRSR